MKGERTRWEISDFFIIGGTIMVIGLVWASFFLFVPAYHSWAWVCSPQEMVGVNYSISGTFNWSDNKIMIYEEPNTEEYDRTLKHELTHRRQKLENRLYSCNNTLGFLLNEIEAYASEYDLVVPPSLSC